MEHELGDHYIRRLAKFIRVNERGLAEGGLSRRRRVQRQATADTSSLNLLNWFALDPTYPSPPNPVILSSDVSHIFYALMRLDAQGYSVGPLDVQVDNPSRPTNYFAGLGQSDSLSLASVRSSLSVVSTLSLGSGWWHRQEVPTLEAELKYIYSSFTKLPALCIHAPEKKVIEELLNDSPNNNALPLDVFKNVHTLECVDIDPTTIIGWDRLAITLRSLRIKNSGLEDVLDIFIRAVRDDQARREGKGNTSRNSTRSISISRDVLPGSVIEDEDGENIPGIDAQNSTSPITPSRLSPDKWASLKHLALPDNSLTFFPTDALSHLTSLTYLDISSNLLNAVPPGLGALHNLVSLNLSDNMIESVVGIYLNLGQVLWINLSHNRLENICGLERLHALEHIDLRSNLIGDCSEIGRLALLPNIAEIWIEGNPFVDIEEDYRVSCFDHFLKEGNIIKLDGSLPSYYERRSLSFSPKKQLTANHPPTSFPSPFVVPVSPYYGPINGTSIQILDLLSKSPSNSNTSPRVTNGDIAEKAPRKKVKRIVELEGNQRARFTPSSSLLSGGSDAELEWANILSEDLDGSPKKSKSHNENIPFQSKPLDDPFSDEVSSILSISPRIKRLSAPVSSLGGILDDDDQSVAAPSFALPLGPAALMKLRLPSSPNSGVQQGTSVYEPSRPSEMHDDVNAREDIKDRGDAYRKRIEALKQDMGDGWLKVFSQTQVRSPL